MADLQASRLQINRLCAGTGALGTRRQSALEARSQFLHRANAHRAGEVPAAAQRETAEASAANCARSRQLRLVFAERRADAVHAGRIAGDGTTGMESSGCIRSVREKP